MPFQAQTSQLTFQNGQRYAMIDIRILDNEIPENAKSFRVQLLNPSGGAAVGIGSVVQVNIQHSDQAFGVFMFADYALFRSVEEVRTNEDQGLPYNKVALTVGDCICIAATSFHSESVLNRSSVAGEQSAASM
jgi:G-protein coupled receptor 98